MGLAFPLERVKKENPPERVMMVAAQYSTECCRDGHKGQRILCYLHYAAIKGIRGSWSITFLSSSKDI